MDWTAVVDFAVGLDQIALCGWLGCGALLALIATVPAQWNKRIAPHGRFYPLAKFEHTK